MARGGGGGGFSGGGSRGGFSGGSRSFSGGSRGSGGFSGGGRGSSGFSGGGRSSGSSRGSYSGGSSYRPSGGSSYRPSGSYRPGGVFRPMYTPGVVVVNNNSNNKYGNGGGGGSNNGNGGSGGGGNSGCGGCLKPLLIVLLVMLVLSLIGTIMTRSGNNDAVRTRLENGTVNSSAGYYANDGFYDSIDGNTLQKGLKDFYDKTGVKPFIYFFSNFPQGYSDTSEIAEAVYDQLIGDEYGGHLVLVWYESDVDDADTYYWLGTQAQTVIDSSALDILTRKIASCYNDEYSYPTYADLLSAAFSQAADDIMADNTSTGAGIVAEVILIILVGTALFLLIRKEKKLEQDKIDAQILSTPLQTFGDTEASAAAKKYESSGTDAAAAAEQSYTSSPAAQNYANSASNAGYSYKVNSGQTVTDDSLKTYADTEAEELAKKYESQD